LRNKSQAPYILNRDGVFYYVRRIPQDVRKHYDRHRLYFSLRTKSSATAARAARSISQKLDDYWMVLRLEQMALPKASLIQPPTILEGHGPTLSEAKELYLRLKGNGKGKVFIRGAERNTQYLTEVAGDKPVDTYTSQDAARFRDWMLERGMTVVTVKRVFATIRSIINLAIGEHGLDCKNAFSGVYMPDDDGQQKRKPIPLENIRSIQAVCRETDDDLRWLVALISDTGMRLAEGAGLAVDDLKLDGEIPYVDIKPHPWRPLKTKTSTRKVPLVGASLWAAKRIKATASGPFAFPRYTDGKETNANSASAALNKWLKSYAKGCVVHSFRHSLRDRLRAVQCPKDITDRLGGWTVGGVGDGYGDGYPTDVLHGWMSKLVSVVLSRTDPGGSDDATFHTSSEII